MIIRKNRLGIGVYKFYRYENKFPSNRNNSILISIGKKTSYKCRLLNNETFGIYIYKIYKKLKWRID